MGSQPDPNFGNGEQGARRDWDPAVHGYMEGHGDVTAQFGRGHREGETLLADGHVNEHEFNGPKGNRGHDHFDGQGSGTNRGWFNS